MNLELYEQLRKENRIPEGTFILGYMGSHSHGTYVPKTDPNSIDDIDLMGVCVPPIECYIGLQNFEQLIHKEDEWDIVTYEARKYFRLLLKSNPNVMGLLWLREQDYVHCSPIAKELIERRELFSSKNIYNSFTGCAYSQFHRMSHYKFEGYMGAKRKELVDRYGYDCKNAAHLIRLLRMGNEFLRTGILNVFREDAEELKQIKLGNWTLEKVKDEARKLFGESEQALQESRLPDQPDTKAVEQLLVKAVKANLTIDFNT